MAPTASVTAGVTYVYASGGACSALQQEAVARRAEAGSVTYARPCPLFAASFPALTPAAVVTCAPAANARVALAPGLEAASFLLNSTLVPPGTLCTLTCGGSDCGGTTPCYSYGAMAYMCDIDGGWAPATKRADWGAGGWTAAVAAAAATLNATDAATDTTYVPDCSAPSGAAAAPPAVRCLPAAITSPSLQQFTVCNTTLSATWRSARMPWAATVASLPAVSASVAAAAQRAAIPAAATLPQPAYSMFMGWGLPAASVPPAVADAAARVAGNDTARLAGVPVPGRPDMYVLPDGTLRCNTTTTPLCAVVTAAGFVPLVGVHVVTVRATTALASADGESTVPVAAVAALAAAVANALPGWGTVVGASVAATLRDSSNMVAVLSSSGWAANSSAPVTGAVPPPVSPAGTLIAASPSIIVNMTLLLAAGAPSVDTTATALDVTSTCATVTVAPLFLTSAAAGAAYRPAVRLLVSDAFAASFLQVRLSSRPADGEVVTVACVAASADGTPALVAIMPPAVRMSAASFAAGRGTVFMTVKAAAAAAAVPVVAAFTTTCNVSSLLSPPGREAVYPTPATLRIDSVVVRARWPFFGDMVMETKNGGLRSAWSSAIIPLPTPVPTPNRNASAANATIPVLWSLPVTLQAALVRNAAVPPAASRPFTVAMAGATNVTLVADTTQHGAGVRTGFMPGMSVLLGGRPCTVWWVSPDGSLARVETPLFSDLCAAAPAGTDCGTATLTIVPPAASVVDLAAVADGSEEGASLQAALASGDRVVSLPVSCPPFCPGETGTVPFTVVAADAASATSSSVPLPTVAPARRRRQLTTTNAATATSAAAYGGRLVPATAIAVSSLGFAYVESCTAAGFTDPASGVCLNESDPAAGACAFGAADGCALCPEGAVCPGGFRAWPRPGYYSPSEGSRDVVACNSPAAERCLGWSASLAAVQCGRGYRQGSVACRACSFGWYPDAATGRCLECQDSQNPVTIIVPILYFVAALAGLGLVMLVVVAYLMHRSGGKLSEGVSISAKFMGTTFVAVQVTATMGREAEPGLPAALRVVLDAVSFLQFQGVTVHPACLAITTGPFFTLYLQGAVVAIMVVAAVGLAVAVERGAWGGPTQFNAAAAAEARVERRNYRAAVERLRIARAVRNEARTAMRLAAGVSPTSAAAAAAAAAAAGKPAPAPAVVVDVTDAQTAPPRASPQPSPATVLDTSDSDDDGLGGGASGGSMVAGGRRRSKAAMAPAAVRTAAAAVRVGKVRHLLFVLLSALYATIATNAMDGVWCVQEVMQVRAYLALDSDGGSLAPAGIPATYSQLLACLDDAESERCGGAARWLDTTLPVSVLLSSPSLVCYEGEHATAAGAAWTLVAVYAVLLPAALWWYVRAHVARSIQQSTKGALYKAAVARERAAATAYVRAGRVCCRPCRAARVAAVGVPA